MNLKRIALVTDYLKTIPEDELNDKSNEMPASIKEESSNYQRKPQNEATHQKGFFKTKIENLENKSVRMTELHGSQISQSQQQDCTDNRKRKISL